MARKKRTKKRSHRRTRRGLSGIGGNMDLMGVVGVIAGAFGGKLINKVIPATLNPKIVAGGKIALGLVLPMFIKGKAQPLVKNIGHGFIAIGTIELLTDMGVLAGLGLDEEQSLVVDLSGIEDVRFQDLDGEVGADVLSADVLSADVPVINGDDVPVINGSYYEV